MNNGYTGDERRSPDPWKTQTTEKLRQLEVSVSCVRRTGEKFMSEYGDILKELVEAKVRREQLWAAATEKLVTTGIWAAVVFLAIAGWEWVKVQLHRG